MTSVADVLGGRYHLVRLLGRGGMSDVYEAIDDHSGGTVAVKIVRSGDPEFVRRLTQEARALESFEHPGLIQLLDTGLTGDDAYLVMEFIDGPTLAETLRKGPLGAPATARLGARLADALAYVHARGIVHRDVKPSNILQSAEGEAWIGDFGIAQLHDATTMTAAGTTLGTVVYMAPEQLEGHQVGPSADIWSLGIVLLECLTGRRVYEGSPSEIVARRLAGPVPLPTDLPVPWTLLFSGMLVTRADQRLSGAQVAAFLATSAYDTPWLPLDADVTERLTSDAPNDLTARMPGLVVPVAVAGDDTVVTARARHAAAVHRARPRWLVPYGAIAVAALCLGLIFWYAAIPSGHAPPTTDPTTTKPPATTTTTTTTTVPSSPNALARLVSALATGQSTGNVDAASGQTISQQAEQALIDAASGNLNQAANDLQQAATTVVNGTQSGFISASEGSTLLHDVANLAAALGVSAPSTTTTTTT
ncbi:MAG TPA: serine/threonine-protein kinase, partial [Acidimicrobiales bacterium]|nr:serine/threonine-protein kinase [Acidimicrobiales bacterium]